MSHMENSSRYLALSLMLVSAYWWQAAVGGGGGKDRHGGVEMGPSKNCDDGKSDLLVDWKDTDDKEYRCRQPNRVLPLVSVQNILSENEKENDAIHICLPTPIDYMKRYKTYLPSSGAHRPVWPAYGTYLYIPPQRWLHALEHGAIVLLYHPCADARGVAQLVRLVRSCLKRHIISPYRRVDVRRPFVLLAWQNRLEMNTIDMAAATRFIKTHAIHGPEEVAFGGDYNHRLLKPARRVSDYIDRHVCPTAVTTSPLT